MIIQRQITSELYLQWPTNTKSYDLLNSAIFNDLERPLHPVSRSHHSLTLNISETARDTDNRHSFNGILIGTYTHPTQQCDVEWSWVTLNDLAKYLMTRSVVRSLCDSWASCTFRKCEEVMAGYVLCNTRGGVNYVQTANFFQESMLRDNNLSTSVFCENAKIFVMAIALYLPSFRHTRTF